MKALFLAALLAQSPAVSPLPQRADLHVVAGWQNLNRKQSTQSYNDWINGIFYGGFGAGYYWTDHLKTQIDFGAGTRARQYRFDQISTGASPGYESSIVTIHQPSLAIGQQYQFFENAWFHPHVGGGLDLAREHVTIEYQPGYVYDPVTRVTSPVAPRPAESATRVIARPFLEAGFKAYMTRRAFFTADGRVKFRGQVDEVLFRFGFGVDF